MSAAADEQTGGSARRAKICMMTSVHTPFDTRVFEKEAKTIAAAGYAVSLVAPADTDEVRDGVRILGVGPHRRRLARLALTVPRVLARALAVGADVYHFHDPELLPCGVMLKCLGKRVVYDAHEDLPRDLLGRRGIPAWLRRPAARLIDAIERACARSLDAVVVARDDIAPRFQAICRTEVVSNYPRLAVFGVPERTRAHNGQVRLVYIGLMSEDRGLAEVVRALALIEPGIDVELSLYGTFSPATFGERLKALPGFERVRYGGWVEHRLVPRILAEADVGIVCFLPDPNNVNAGPTKLFEYLGAGLPVIASNFPLWRDTIEGNGCGICVDPHNPRDIADAIQRLSKDPAARLQMGNLARRAVERLYNWEAQAQCLLDLYASLTARAGGHRPS